MDCSMGRRTASGIIFSKSGCSITFREQNHHARSIRSCSRLGCGANFYSMKGTKVGEQDKAPFHTGSSKLLPASSFRRPQRGGRTRRSPEEADVAESSNSQRESDKIKCTSRSLDIKDSDSRRGLGKKEDSHSTTGEEESCSNKLRSKTSKEVTRQSRYHYKDNLSTFASTSMAHAYGLENPTRAGVSNVRPSGFNSPNSGSSRTANNIRKRSLYKASPSSSGKSMIPSSSGTNSGLDVPRRAPRRSRNQSPNGVRGVPQSSSRLSTDFNPLCHNVHGQPGSSTRIAPIGQIHEPVASSTHTFDASLEDRDGYPHLVMEEVAEQLSLLGNHLFLDSLSFNDQYRDMRMDIDNMSYEELLVLEEKIGTVSTALTEEALSRCLKRSNYMPASLISGFSGLDEAGAKCSICQEEFVVGDELGELACEHAYHVKCIHQWLGLKNWCPICKASVSPTS
uniref:RING-type E3 ubiquitin transferase n=1 Tax=Musa acuminata subsp. malaccensis TaxID=214687 RepID=A0A804HVT1_MUSAM|nr:PREDICTED: E3 ubiquitin-protein ligase MBR2-like isoform X2 [Musa acuminata subsp. malaccensis]